MWSFALHVTRSTLERLEKEFIDSASINRIINNLSARNNKKIIWIISTIVLSGPLLQKYKSLSCKLCLMEKYYIIKDFNDPSLINRKLDLTNKCRHQNTILLMSVKRWYSFAIFIIYIFIIYIFYLKENMTWESSDLIHVVICSTCNEEYIGETGEDWTRSLLTKHPSTALSTT